jgi:hypothetical protein
MRVRGILGDATILDMIRRGWATSNGWHDVGGLLKDDTDGFCESKPADQLLYPR